MTWRNYEVILRLRSPLHMGRGAVGNLQRTRSYIVGRALWGALTMRLTRDQTPDGVPATDSQDYRKIGDQVHSSLKFTYFYPSLQSANGIQVVWPWQNESAFRRRFLSSYAATALTYPQQGAAEGLLHEVEFISAHTVDTGEAVYLKGYVFEAADCSLRWQSAFQRLQLGGERGYGWGQVELVSVTPAAQKALFGSVATFEGEGEEPVIKLPAAGRLLAHAPTNGLSATGDIEPLVGREWRSNNLRQNHVGQHIEFSGVCFTPGSSVTQATKFAIGDFGLWHMLP